MAAALSDFRMVHGFRPLEQIAETLRRIPHRTAVIRYRRELEAAKSSLVHFRLAECFSSLKDRAGAVHEFRETPNVNLQPASGMCGRHSVCDRPCAIVRTRNKNSECPLQYLRYEL